MSTSLDKSLDEIIAGKPSIKKTLKGKKVGAKNAKVGKSALRPRPGVKKAVAPPAASEKVIDASYATKAVVYGLGYLVEFLFRVFIEEDQKAQYGLSGLKGSYHLHNRPKDIKQDAIKDFFSSQVGGIHTVALSYNEKGQSKGIATIIFKNAAAAQRAVTKYNGAPIDGGKNNLKIELILDPTKKPLTSRIQANATPQKAKTLNIKANKPAKAGKPKPKAKKPVKKTKKSLEELDQEMTDYFEKK